ncbi:MAG: UDP-N-acetylmuramoyl-L-alanine--D-glutamate ligase [Ruminococcaceae bacterium]|nr:UDP-N-acetylmuramoyl-L-alanine--D-glutamate ligase [Oscillospiraceae bacterium]
MQKELEQFCASVNGKEVGVIGIGISNRPLISYLVELGAKVTAFDKRSAGELGDGVAEELEKMGVRLCLGADYLEHLEQELIFRTPGMRYDLPQLEAARARGAVVTSEMEVFFEVCPAHIVAITGSDGKTTTTTLIHKMLSESGYKTWLGGNIGNPLLTDARNMKPEDWVVLELSSFQLHTLKKSPEIAVITNLSPNHLDYHKDYQEYIDAKKNIYLHQTEADLLVTNLHNQDTKKLIPEAKGRCITFSIDFADGAEITRRENVIYKGNMPVLDCADIRLPGTHNIENYMTAIGAVSHLVKPEIIQKIAKEFGGVPHRIELVREKDGVRYYNSSIDSSPNRTMNTLKVFPEKVILIAGGKDKGIPYDDIGPVIVEHVKHLILIGATKDKIQEAVEKASEKAGVHIPVQIAETYEQVVEMAVAVAKPGDVVILSPASTSFDMFRNFEERGNLFKKLVCEL